MFFPTDSGSKGHNLVGDSSPADCSAGLWRQGELLVMGKDAVLPDICVKTGLPAGGHRIQRSLRCPLEPQRNRVLKSVITALVLYPLVFALFWYSDDDTVRRLIGFAIVAFTLGMAAISFFGKPGARVDVDLAVSKKWLLKRRMAILLGCGIVVGGCVVFLFGALMANRRPELAWLMPGGLLLGLAGLVYLLPNLRIVYVDRIEQGRVWLGGIHPALLSGLREWPVREQVSSPPKPDGA